MARSLETDYLVVGAGAMGMAFTDALIDHADVHVTLVDRRHAAGGHWHRRVSVRPVAPGVRVLRVASTVLGSGVVQLSGPEAGLQERARQSEIRAYYDHILHRRFVGSGRVTFLGASEHHAARLVPSRDVSGVGRDRASGREAPARRRHVPVADDSRDDAAAVQRR